MSRTKRADICKDATITVRISREEKDRIKKKAAKDNKTASEYILDAAMAGLERRSNKDKKRIMQMIENQEILNDIFEFAEKMDMPEELYAKIEELMKGENRLWQC